MRLSAEKVKEAILSPDQELREAAVYYFAGSHSDDPSLMPKVIEAFDKYGNAAFETFSFLDDLAQTNESVAWLCRQVEKLNPDADEQTSNFFTGCVAALAMPMLSPLRPDPGNSSTAMMDGPVRSWQQSSVDLPYLMDFWPTPATIELLRQSSYPEKSNSTE